MKNRTLALLCNLVVAVMVPVAWLLMALQLYKSGALSSAGLASLKYFTVLSNFFNGAVSLLFVLWLLSRKEEIPRWLPLLKLMSTVAVGLTFFVVVAFLGPLYGYGSMYLGANLWFHLLLPLISMLEFCLFDVGFSLSLRATLSALIPTLLYGCAYAVNLLVNGVGVYPHSNDWYGFAHWGFPIGFGIFAAILLVTWALALLLRAGNRVAQKRRERLSL